MFFSYHKFLLKISIFAVLNNCLQYQKSPITVPKSLVSRLKKLYPIVHLLKKLKTYTCPTSQVSSIKTKAVMVANEFVASCLITPIMHATQFEHIVKTLYKKASTCTNSRQNSYHLRFVNCNMPSLIRNKRRPGVAISTSKFCRRLSS